MLHKIKKRKPVYNPTHSVWWCSQNRTLSLRSRAVILTRASQTFMTLWSMITRLVNLIPLLSILALALLSISMISLPWNNSNVVYAVEDMAEEDAATRDVGDARNAEGISAQSSTPSISLTYSGSNELSNAGSINDGEASTIVKLEKAITITGELITNYNLQISSNTDSTTLEGPSSITTTTTNANTAEDLADNTWGYSWNNTTYQGITTTPTTIESTNLSSTNNYSINTTKNLSFAAKFNQDARAGHYKTSVKLLLTATPKALVTYTLAYNANGGSAAPTNQTTTSYDDSAQFTISSTKPTKSGYTFLGWSTSSSATTASYQPSGTIALQATAPSQTLWAVWKAQDSWNSITTMQQMTPTICANAPSKTPKTLTDSRDGSTYTVAKLDDGKCWMTQNLRIMGSRTLTSSDSDVTSNYTLPASSTSGFSDNTASNAYLSGSTGYYTWCAATAGSCSSATSTGANATSSICPKGWKLPTGMVTGANTTNDFYNLFKNKGLTISSSLSATGGTSWGTGDLAKVQGSPYNFAYTGYMYNGSLSNATSNGYWWSRTAHSSTIYAYILVMNGSVVYPGTNIYNGTRHLGFAVRCVAE